MLRAMADTESGKTVAKEAKNRIADVIEVFDWVGEWTSYEVKEVFERTPGALKPLPQQRLPYLLAFLGR